jgi:hypothetical protein
MDDEHRMESMGQGRMRHGTAPSSQLDSHAQYVYSVS